MWIMRRCGIRLLDFAESIWKLFVRAALASRAFLPTKGTAGRLDGARKVGGAKFAQFFAALLVFLAPIYLNVRTTFFP